MQTSVLGHSLNTLIWDSREPMNNLVTTHVVYVVCVFVVMKVLNSFIALLNYSSSISSAAKPISKWARSVSVSPVCLDISLPLRKFLFEVLYHNLYILCRYASPIVLFPNTPKKGRATCYFWNFFFPPPNIRLPRNAFFQMTILQKKNFIIAFFWICMSLWLENI